MSTLKVYDKSHTFKAAFYSGLNYKDLKIASDVSSGDKTLSFTKIDNVEIEGYIRTEKNEYVIKQINGDTVTCALNLEDLEAKAYKTFSVTDVTIEQAVRLAVTGTGWTVAPCSITKKRNAGILKKNALGVVNDLCTAFMCEIEYDTINKIIYLLEEKGSDKGVYFLEGLNLKRLTKKESSYDYYTKIIPYGSDDLDITEVNDGKNYLENYQYSDKEKTYIWTDTSYTDAEALKEDAIAKLADMSRPEVGYSADIIDLANASDDYNALEYHIGDTIKLISENAQEKQRIVKMTEHPDDPTKNTCELSNTFLTWEDLQNKLQASAQIVNAVISSDGTYDGTVKVSDILRWNDEINSAVEGSTYLSNYVTTTNGRLALVEAEIGSLDVNYLQADFANLATASIDVAKLGDLYAASGILQSVVIEDGHVTGSLSGVTINGDLINANTLKADKLVIKGTDGLYYQLNTNGESVSSEQTEYNSLNGSNILAQSIDATKINVSDLVAFNATIGGYSIDEDSIHTIGKASALDNAEGVYMSPSAFEIGASNGNHISYTSDGIDIKTEWLEFDTDNNTVLIKEPARNALDGSIVGYRTMKLDGSGKTEVSSSDHNLTPTLQQIVHKDDWSQSTGLVLHLNRITMNGSGNPHLEGDSFRVEIGGDVVLDAQKAIKTADENNPYLICHNGTNLWIGAKQGATKHHTGRLILSSGYDGSQGYESVQIAIPNDSNDGAMSYNDIYHTGNRKALINYSANIGSAKVTATARKVVQTGSVTIPYTGEYQTYVDAPLYTSKYTATCRFEIGSTNGASVITNATEYKGIMSAKKAVTLTAGTYTYNLVLVPQNGATATLENYNSLSFGLLPV